MKNQLQNLQLNEFEVYSIFFIIMYYSFQSLLLCNITVILVALPSSLLFQEIQITRRYNRKLQKNCMCELVRNKLISALILVHYIISQVSHFGARYKPCEQQLSIPKWQTGYTQLLCVDQLWSCQCSSSNILHAQYC